MSKKKIVLSENYLDKTPLHHPDINWTVDEKGLVSLEIENVGFFNRVAQKLFKRPKISYVHLDENGSFIWLAIDGEKDITAIGKDVDGRFGEVAHPLYERLVKFFWILDSYHFIVWK